MNDLNKIWDFEGSDPEIFKKHFNCKMQSADAKNNWVKTQTCSMEDIREYEKEFYNENKNNRN